MKNNIIYTTLMKKQLVTYCLMVICNATLHSMDLQSSGSLIVELIIKNLAPLDHSLVCTMAGTNKATLEVVEATTPQRSVLLQKRCAEYNPIFSTMHKYGSACGFIAVKFVESIDWHGDREEAQENIYLSLIQMFSYAGCNGYNGYTKTDRYITSYEYVTKMENPTFNNGKLTTTIKELNGSKVNEASVECKFERWK